jgi:hypothetical protein
MLFALVLVGCTAVDDGPRSGDASVAFRESFRIQLEDSPIATIGQVRDILPLPDQLLVADGMTNRILAFDMDGSFLKAVGRDGEGPGEFRNPQSMIQMRDGSVLVADLTARLTQLTADLDLIAVHRIDVPNFVTAMDLIDDQVVLMQWASRIAGNNLVLWDPDSGFGPSFDPRSDLVLTVPYWNAMWTTHVASGPSDVYVADNMAYPFRRYAKTLQLMDTVGSAPPSWRQARRPSLGEFAGSGMASADEWKRSFTTIQKLAVVQGQWLIATHVDRVNQYSSDDLIHADLYEIGEQLRKKWVDVRLPGRLVRGGNCAWVIVAEPPSPWTIACMEPLEP